MYYRRKVILALLEAFGCELEKLRLQKLLFLLTTRQQKPAYDFVPYKFGCFSFQANADLGTMGKYQQVVEEERVWRKTDTAAYLPQLLPADQRVINRLIERFQNATADELIHYTYTQHPWYALNSKVKETKLNATELAAVEQLRNTDIRPCLFTIGYEGVSVEAYLNKLLHNGVKVLCDVRRNPLSMKYGFSKKQLENACNGVGIVYTHIPQLGIPSEFRQELNSQADYDTLFCAYQQRIEHQTSDLQIVSHLMATHKRIALTCFEANVCQCHRGTLANHLATLPGWEYPVQHIQYTHKDR